MRHVSDRHQQAKAASIVRVRFGEHGVVEVSRVGPVDGDQRHLAQVGAAAQPDTPGALCLFQRGLRKHLRDVVGVDGDQADRAGITQLAQPLQHPRRLQPQMRMPGDRFGHDDLIGLGAGFLPSRHDPLRLRPPISWHDTIFPPVPEHAEDATRGFANPPHGPALIAARADGFQPYQNPLPRRQRRRALSFGMHEHDRRRPSRALPIHGSGNRITIAVHAGDLNNRGVGEFANGTAHRRAVRRRHTVPPDRLA